ncbi:hypothetical protein ADUPG1_003569 [Aduncisulcus paluster]|uniref:CBS domain-containing protein n=1 Tax=Aduncisulcus paluster TaxID=2918883 RepID=A0ABQ5KYY1_9EUKA|nr:hypothetical protein ADUPG1_003569 [Aduncisulcus paluster]
MTLRDMRAFLKNAQDLKGAAEVVDTLMVRTVVSLPVNSNLKEAIMKFERTGVSFLPLLNQDETVAGIIKSKDAMNTFRQKGTKIKFSLPQSSLLRLLRQYLRIQQPKSYPVGCLPCNKILPENYISHCKEHQDCAPPRTFQILNSNG